MSGLNHWAKKNGVNPNEYSKKELSKLRQSQHDAMKSEDWNDTFDKIFYSSCKRIGIVVKE